MTEAGDGWPSGVVRALIYRDELARQGIDARFVTRRVPLLEKALAGRTLVSRLGVRIFGRWLPSKINAAIGRLHEPAIVAMARNYDIVYLVKVNSLRLVDRLKRETRARIVFDLNDSLWLPGWTWFAEGRISELLGKVDGVLCDNAHGVAYARRFNRDVHLVPDCPQLELFDGRRPERDPARSPVVLGWIGSPSTVFNLFAIWEPLERLFAKHSNITLRLVGVGDGKTLPPFEQIRFTARASYNQDQMIEEVGAFDIGLFPLFDVEDSRARGVLKAMIYQAGGAAAVCSRIGSVPDLITDGDNGLLATSAADWLAQLERLIADAALRRSIAARGLETLRSRYSVERCCKLMVDALVGNRPAVTS